MATNQTQNYGLSQWLPGDNFSREDFNADNAKLDAALQTVKTAGESGVNTLRQEVQSGIQTLTQATQNVKDQLLPVTYNVYQLMLQNYYDGKVTAGKKALLFDGFLDESGVASKSGVYIQNQSLGLFRSGESAKTVTAGVQCYRFLSDSPTTPLYTATGPGKLTGLSVTYREDVPSMSQQAYLVLNVNGQEVQRTTLTLTTGAALNNSVTRQFNLGTPVTVMPGDTYQFTLSGPNRWFALYLDAAKNYLAGSTVVTGLGATSGSMTAKAVAGMPVYDRALLYLRYTGGSVTPNLNGKSMTKLSTRQTVNLQNQPCTEDCWSYGGGSGSTAVGLSLSVGSSQSCLVHDYGLTLL